MTEFLETVIDKFIFRAATDRRYDEGGVWVLQENDGVRLRLGVSDYRQQLNGDAAFAHVRPVGTVVGRGETFVEMETIKAAVEFASPVAGTIVAVNPALDTAPEIINEDPYGRGWLAVIEPVEGEAACEALLDAERYLAVVRSQAAEEMGS